MNIDVIHWIKTHKFWTSVIVLFVVMVLVRVYGKPLEFSGLYTLFFYYTMVFGLVWSGYVGKKGMTLITWGIVALLASFFPWASIIGGGQDNTSIVYFAVIPTVAGIALIGFGARRYWDWLRGNT